MRFMFALAALVIAAPVAAVPIITDQHDVGRDGYEFESKEVEIKTDVKVRLITFTDASAYRAEYRKRVPTGPIPNAFSVLTLPARDVCTIYTIDPIKNYRPDLYGHELMHCFFGNFHPTLGSR